MRFAAQHVFAPHLLGELDQIGKAVEYPATIALRHPRQQVPERETVAGTRGGKDARQRRRVALFEGGEPAPERLGGVLIERAPAVGA